MEDRSSDLYRQPEDRLKFAEQESDVTFDDENSSSESEVADFTPIRESQKQVELTTEEIALKKSKRSFGWFVAFCIIDLLFAAYIVYIVITVFANLG